MKFYGIQDLIRYEQQQELKIREFWKGSDPKNDDGKNKKLSDYQ